MIYDDMIHSSQIFAASIISDISMYFQAKWKTLNSDQMALSEASWSGSTLFSKEDIFRFNRTQVKNYSLI